VYVPYIAVDLDGTLAHYSVWEEGSIGEPVPLMLERVKRWLSEGKEVRIFTARVGSGGGYSIVSGRRDDEAFIAEQRALIEEWCMQHLGCILPVTASKDWGCEAIWDDIAIQIVPHTGQRVDGNS
jgi:hypothetical protein